MTRPADMPDSGNKKAPGNDAWSLPGARFSADERS